MKDMVLLVGLPRSGKSSLANLNLKLPKNEQFIILNADSIRESLFDKYSLYSDEPLVWSLFDMKFTKALSTGQEIVVVNNNNLKKEYRISLIETAKKFGYSVGAITVKAESKEEQYKSLKKCNFPLDVFHRMVDSYEEPQMDEGFSEIKHLISFVEDGEVFFKEDK